MYENQSQEHKLNEEEAKNLEDAISLMSQGEKNCSLIDAAKKGLKNNVELLIQRC